MTNPMDPNSRTIPDGDATKIRPLGIFSEEDYYQIVGVRHGFRDWEARSHLMTNAHYLDGYFAGCDARRGIER